MDPHKLKKPELQRIIEGCIEENDSCRRELYDAYSSKLFAVCRRYMGNTEDAQDVFQESMVIIYLKIEQFDFNRGDFEAWIYRITVNEAIRQLKKKHQHLMEPLDIKASDVSISFEDSVTLNDLKKLIDQLPVGQKTIFNLAVVEGYKHEEISKILNIGVSTSRSQLHRAKEALRDFITTENFVPAPSSI